MRNILGVEALLMLWSSKIFDGHRTTRRVINRNKWLQEQRKQEKKDDHKLNQHWGVRIQDLKSLSGGSRAGQ